MINTSFQQYGIYTSAEPLDGDLIQAYRVYHITNILSLDRDSGARVSQRILRNRLPIRQSFFHIDPASPAGMASSLFNNVLSIIPASSQNRVLIHCSRGKDRTGFAVAAFLIKKGIYKPCDAISAVTNELGYGTGGIGAMQKNSMDRILGCGQVAETEETEEVTEEIKESYYKYLNLFKKGEDVFDNIDVSSVNQITAFCGPASLKAAMEQYGIFVSMEEIGKVVGCDENGVEAEALVEGAKKFGLNAYFEDNVSVEKIKEMVRKDIPVIVDWFKEDDGHYSVVIDVNDTELQIMDPETGEKVWMVWEEFVPIWFDFKIGDHDHEHPINRRAIFILPGETIKAVFNASLLKFSSTYWGKKASGILFVCSEDNTVLLLKRSNLVHNGGTWGIPGGAIAELGENYYSESNEEDPQEDLFISSAKTETLEELGSLPTSFKEIGQTIFRDENFTYKTFVYDLSLKEKKGWTANIVLNWENDNYRWFDINNLPANIHPGVLYSLNQLYKPSDVNDAFLGGGPSGSPTAEDQGNPIIPGYIEDTEKRNKRRERLLKLLSRIEKEENLPKQPSGIDVGLGNTYMGGQIANTFNTPSGSSGSSNSVTFSEPAGYVQL